MVGQEFGEHRDREYQRACVAEAIHNNVIVVLPTGSGKTRIALRVIQDAMRKLAAQGAPNQAPDETAHAGSNESPQQRLQAASQGANAAPGPNTALPDDQETKEAPKRRLAAVFLAPTVALCMQQADVLKVAGLRVALMCAGVAETLNPDASNSDSEEDEESSDEGQGEKGSHPSLVKHSRQSNFSAAEARAIAAEIGEWNGDGEEWELEMWREQFFKGGVRARKEKSKKGGEVDAKASGTLLKGRLGPSSTRCWAALLSGAYDVLVATPAELLQGLVHASIRVSDVAVWVLDEAHHASGNHPYAILMSSFMHNTPKHLRPRIVGLTATPLQLLTRKDAPPDASAVMKQQAFLPAGAGSQAAAVGSPPLLTNGQCSSGSVALVPSQAANGGVASVGPGGHVRMGRSGPRSAVGVSEPCALEQLLDAHIISAPDSGVVSSIVPAVIERCVSYPVSAMSRSLESALKVVAEAQNTLRQIARHRQLRSLLMTQETLAEVAQQQLHEQTNEEGMDGVIEASPRNMYHTLSSQLDAALFCGRELGLWACLASLKHGLLSAVDSRV
ncbi:hypothetical protein DUNSADRAFT_5830 [Dunaliella salina]|uniref:Helicase ATP-binding domain-containing protein n=1 Tax=Dunaliella salina TaxID=3046 RepID=A0ABQ7GPL0_DUNSA|nr:hypothetical protein DUNSADRAFT_5830 [Dunaliella salina]|eukprot:KAF5836542.1 hypothetical protein DUNSADRAFT_5830 [Dunaliella salina]